MVVNGNSLNGFPIIKQQVLDNEMIIHEQIGTWSRFDWVVLIPDEYGSFARHLSKFQNLVYSNMPDGQWFYHDDSCVEIGDIVEIEI